MDEIMAGGEDNEADWDDDPFEEFQRYFDSRKCLPSREECPDPIAWWGVRLFPSYTLVACTNIPFLQSHGSPFPVLRLMAKDYLGIAATTCLIERAFSMSARTDDARRRRMKKKRFGALQRLRDGYRDGRISAATETWVALEPDFTWKMAEVDDSDDEWEDAQ
jgi:hAT family C-terminal dimerisation region